MELTGGSILRILNSQTPDNPVFQVINVKKITGANAKDRYRLLISDGENTFSHVMLSVQMNSFIENDELKSLSIFKADNYMCNNLGDKRVIILTGITVVSSCGE